MQWDAVQTEAKTKGTLVFAMDQSQTAVLTEPGPWGSAFDGYCIGLAARWISLQYDGLNYPYDKASKVFESVDWRATIGQNSSDSSADTSDVGYWESATKPFQLGLSAGLRFERHGKPSGSIIKSAMSHAYGCYGITLRRDGSAHGICARHGRDNKFHLFDANYGHFTVNHIDTFRTFLDWYLDKTGYRERYTKSCFVIGIKPPATIKKFP